MPEEKKVVEENNSDRMMNLNLHVQGDVEVELVKKVTGLKLENDPQGVYIGRGEAGLEDAANRVFERIQREGYKHVLIGGCVGLVAKLVYKITSSHAKGEMQEVSFYEFENQKRRDSRGHLMFEPINVRKVV